MKRNHWTRRTGGLALAMVSVFLLGLEARAQSNGPAEPPSSREVAHTSDARPANASRDADVKCVVVQWELPASGTPKLTILCPPAEIFAPLRVYIQLGWKSAEGVPENYLRIIAPSGALTKIRSNRAGVAVWLKVGQENPGTPQTKWVSFDTLLSVGLQQDANRP